MTVQELANRLGAEILVEGDLTRTVETAQLGYGPAARGSGLDDGDGKPQRRRRLLS